MTAPSHPGGDEAVRRRIESELDATLMVVAGAGTGKTTALVGRIVQLVRSGRAALGEIAAITFTEAAAAELRQRVRDRIEEEAAAGPGDPRLEAARHEVDEAAICTLHAFAQRILTEHAVAAGIPPGFDVLDETAERADFESRFEHFADALLADPGVEDALVRGFSVGLARVDLAEIAWALHRHWDRLEDGGMARLERGRPEPGHWPPAAPGPVVAALDQAIAMAQWCTDDGDKLKAHIDDTLVPLRARLGECTDDRSTLQVLDGVRSLASTYGQRGNWGERAEEVRAACQRAEDARVAILQATRHAVLGELGARLGGFVMTAANERRAEGRLGFHDLLVLARRLLRHDGAATAALRRRYRRLLIDEFQDTDPIQVELAARLAAVVDGSADLGAAAPGGLFVVGDPKQSIYRFRRADIESFARVGREIGDAIVLVTNFRSVPGILDFVNTVFAELFGRDPVPGQAAHHDLQGERDALPPRAPLAAAYRARGGRRGRGLPMVPPSPGRASGYGDPGQRTEQLALAGFALSPPEADGADPEARPRPRTAGPPPVVLLGGALRGTAADVRRAAARDVAGALGDVVAGRWAVADPEDGHVRAARWRDVAVLLPARTGLAALEEALEDARIPYRLEGVAMLWGSEEVRDVLAVLGAADDPADAVAVLRALRSPGLACGDDDLVTWHHAGGSWDPRADPPPGCEAHPVAPALALLARLHDQRWWHEPSAMMDLALAELHSFELCLAYHRPRDHWHRLRWLQDQARLFDETVGGPLRSFLQWAELQSEDDRHSGAVGPPDPDDDAVRVMTVHGAKGLEFPVVVLAGLEREAGTGLRSPAVLWDEDGTPELRARKELKSSGYDAVVERERELDALEQHRLLYVGMTRARDHLVLALHHKELREGSSAAPSEGARLADICERHPALWRRLATAETTPQPERPQPERPQPGQRAADGGAPAEAEARVAAAFGLSAPVAAGGSGADDGDVGSGDGDETDRWRDRVRAFAEARARTLSAGRRAPVTSATAVAERLDAGPGPLRAQDPGAPGATGALWRQGDVALQVGRAVHAALAALDLTTGTDAAGRPAAEVARGRALAQGVAEHADAVVAMVEAALRSPTVAAGAGRRHWRELYVAVPAGADGVLEGYVDLVVELDGSLVVVDYKTDRVDATKGVAAAARRYGPQVAAYADALEQATGIDVARCVLVFVGSGQPVEHAVEGEGLQALRTEARRAAGELVAPT